MVPDRDPDVLLARIDGLERRLADVTRILSICGVVAVLAGAAALASQRAGVVVSAQGRGPAPAMVASRITLVDAGGKPRAALYVDGQTAGLALSDPGGQTRVLLNTDGESSKLAIVGAAKGFPR